MYDSLLGEGFYVCATVNVGHFQHQVKKCYDRKLNASIYFPEYPVAWSSEVFNDRSPSKFHHFPSIRYIISASFVSLRQITSEIIEQMWNFFNFMALDLGSPRLLRLLGLKWIIPLIHVMESKLYNITITMMALGQPNQGHSDSVVHFYKIS